MKLKKLPAQNEHHTAKISDGFISVASTEGVFSELVVLFSVVLLRFLAKSDRYVASKGGAGRERAPSSGPNDDFDAWIPGSVIKNEVNFLTKVVCDGVEVFGSVESRDGDSRVVVESIRQ